MRNLAQPQVLKSATLAALVTALASLPRVSQWPQRPYMTWYMETMIFLGCLVLWGFVFAWHTAYSGRPIFTFKSGAVPFALATLLGVFVAITLRRFLDPSLRLATPQDFPATVGQWLTMTMFGLAFTQLFLLFAPLAWALRIFQNRVFAIAFTILFSVFVVVFKADKSTTPMPNSLLLALVLVRLVEGLLSVWFYWRGGVILACWWSLLLRARLLIDLAASA